MTGLADPMMGFPAGTTFTPYSVLRNVSDEAISITPRLYWMQAGAAHSAKLPAFTLSPKSRWSSRAISEAQGESERILLVMDPEQTTCRRRPVGLTFCRTYIGAHETFIDYDPWVLPVASSVQETFTAQYNTGSQFNLTSAASWTSGNTSIATVSAGKVAARAAGTTFVAANDPNTPDYTSGCYAYSIECPLETGEEGQAAGTINATIRLNGTAISSQQPGSIVIGQQATLSMDTGGESVSQATWTVGGTTVASWPAGAPPPTPNFNQNSPVFYWVPPYGGLSAFPTSWSVPISVSGTLSNGTSVVGSASVTVLAPSVSVTPSSSDAIYLINASTVGAECGNTVSTYRMQLAPSVVPPSGISGTYEWVQVENSSGYTYVATDGTQHSCSISQPLPGLDNANPYPNSTNAIFVDSPALAPQPTGKQTITVSKSFSAVLMWQPSGSNSIWVPLSSTN